MSWRWILFFVLALTGAAYVGAGPPAPPPPPSPAPAAQVATEARPPPAGPPIPHPDTPPLGLLGSERAAAAVERLRRCGAGDAIVTIEEAAASAGALRVVVRRRGQPCFRVSFLSGTAPQALEAGPTWTPQGEPGPLAIVAALPLSAPPADLFAPHEKASEIRLVVVSWAGERLLDRGLRTRSFRAGVERGESVELRPLFWDGDRLFVWVSSRGFHGEATQCVGSLLQVPLEGAMEVVEGLPCEAVSLLDADGDGSLEIRAASSRLDHRDAPWQGVVSGEGAILAALPLPWEESLLLEGKERGPSLFYLSATEGPRLAPWPWSEGAIALQGGEAPAFAADLDGDGSEELLLREAGETRVHDGGDGRFLYRIAGATVATRRGRGADQALVADTACGIAAFGVDAAGSCAPALLAGFRPLDGLVGAFDWSGDGTLDPLLLPAAADGPWRAAIWSEGGLASFRSARGMHALLPLHAARRVLDLGPVEHPALLLPAEEDFAVVDAWTEEVRLLLSRSEGVLRAIAVPVDGPPLGQETLFPPRWGRL